MKRDAIAVILQPYKNRLMPRAKVKESIDGFAEQLLAVSAEYPEFRFNVALPGYVLECINPLTLSKLREMHRRGSLEWLLTGYTEPFLSFFPQKLTENNIRHGMQVFTELTGVAPSGFMPPFSNWEPSHIATLRAAGLGYIVLSSAALPPQARNCCGYWTTEHAGNAITLFPGHLLHHYSAPADVIDWLEKLVARDDRNGECERFVAIHYLVSLKPEAGIDPYRWLKHTAAELNKRILVYQTVLFGEALSLQPPAGLQHLASCLAAGPNGGALNDAPGETPSPYFLNRLHSFDQVGIIQRKMLDAFDRIASIKENRLAADLMHRLYFLQDINRYVPRKSGDTVAGFPVMADRLWSYAQLIDIERILRENEGSTGGRIRISDFLRNGSKSIVMSNDRLTVYCDYKNGGRLFELDFCDRSINLFAAFNPDPHAPPDILSPGKTFASFIDRIHAPGTTGADFIAGAVRDLGNFAAGSFEYKIKKTGDSIKLMLNRQGSFPHGDKAVALSVEKVFGIEKNDADLSFVYQCNNLSLTATNFTFATELYCSFPGAADHNARAVNGKTVVPAIGWEPVVFEKTTKWSISDFTAGVRIQIVTQKPVDVTMLPVSGNERHADPACGVRIVLSAPVALDQSSSWSLIGTISCKKIRKNRKEPDDAV
jgi:hypothetical protein